MHRIQRKPVWKLYSKSDEAIAVQSTFATLRNGLPERVEAGLNYVDYDTYSFPLGPLNPTWPFAFKRISFQHEQELRALILEPPFQNGQLHLDYDPYPPGQSVSVDLSKLIESVYIAPSTPDWYFDLVSRITTRLGFELQVKHSLMTGTFGRRSSMASLR